MDTETPRTFDFLLLGEQSLLVQCAGQLRERGHAVRGIVTEDARVRRWAEEHGIAAFPRFEALRDAAPAPGFDYLLSITNLRMLPAWLLGRARLGAINFHDGPLPRYAGLNAPVWALANGEREYGVTWHEIAAGADRGRILAGRTFPVRDHETSFGLNAQCYEAGLESFAELLAGLETGGTVAGEQDFRQRSYFGLVARPERMACLDWQRPVEELDRLVRALDFGNYPNPVMLPKIDLGGRVLLVRTARKGSGARSGKRPGTLIQSDAHSLTVACGDASMVIERATDLAGREVDVAAVLASEGFTAGSVLPVPPVSENLKGLAERLARHESWWLRQFRGLEFSDAPFSRRDTATQGAPLQLRLALECRDPETLIASLLLVVARLTNRRDVAMAFVSRSLQQLEAGLSRFACDTAVLALAFEPGESLASWRGRVAAQLQRAEERLGWLSDLPARAPEARQALLALDSAPIRLVRCQSIEAFAPGGEPSGPGHSLTLCVDESGRILLAAPASRFDVPSLARLAANWQALSRRMEDVSATCDSVSVLTEEDEATLARFAGTRAMQPARQQRIHEQFEAQVRAAPERRACVYDGESMSYRELNVAANRIARFLKQRGVVRGDLVGVRVPRSLDLVASLLGVLKAGAAYVPLDPTYPEERLAQMIADSGVRVVLTLPEVRAARESAVADANVAVPGEDSDLAYVIYTSGSTGKPKGVMVEHRQVANFFSGIDGRFGTEPGTWLAVTSISFDISVLELLWTLARGFTVVIHGDALRLKDRALPAATAVTARRGPDFSLFYWNVARSEADYDTDKYRLLLDSARFADDHGFVAVWTPERHFEAFGGLYPNPSVTSAALATLTKNVQLRAGSCVVPLHSPIRIAEEWAVVDNLSHGRVGLSVASGWAPPDFVIKPENFADAKQVMFESTEILRRLWRGETVPFQGPKGEVKVRTLPRPVQPELPIWVTTAGNVDTYIQAGRIGANILTHLLGQTLEDVAAKVAAYRAARAEAGHAGNGIVTLMLHTLVGRDAQDIERIVRQPMKDYLRSAIALVKAAAWQFPTFRKLSEEQGRSLDDFFANMAEQDMDDLLEFAFQRYFHDSGLFGTPEQCLKMVARVETAGVDEIACLIDFGIGTDVVLEHLPFLDELRALAQRGRAASADHSLAGLLSAEKVTHLQCTPTLATMLASDEEALPGLAGLRELMVGGEALPPELARTLTGRVGGRVSNMYGPTETTIWSTVGVVDESAITGSNSVSVGTPLANQTVQILDDGQQGLPPGIVGEIAIGGAGVTRGYWQRPDLTAERFVGEPRAYLTGDLGRFLPDGRIECLGRRDQQVKIRGYRVELGEIEAVLREQPQVREAAVVLREFAARDQRLVGYVVMRDGADADEAALRQALGRRLPEFMVPASMVTLRSLPLTPNGKVDRKALPAPGARRAIATSAASVVANASAPTAIGNAEALVLEIWRRALGVEDIGPRDNFFDIGGHSLLVIQVLKELRARVPRPIQLTDLFRHTTVESLARFIEGGTAEGGSASRGRSRAEARRAAMTRG